MSTKTPVTVAYGDGIGPEIMEALLTDTYRCRFSSAKNRTTGKQTGALLGRVLDQGIEIAKTETLSICNGNVGYSLAQGQ